ncbi:MAG: aminotransferase class III-fold pyridoxal phosphate-dependent enzyme [Bryobacterales bacterium]|nr:aminotransferase class III-fold pyridoxal phosphate-dependent enzyme [Bryobacterales bacterium]
MSRILAAYEERTPGSRRLHQQASALLPNGVTHVGRYLHPYPIYVERAQGSRKWDVDGNEYVDFFGGHGALILGHNHPAVMEAVSRQLSRGVHYGASHELEVRWAELIHQMIPSAERIRFTVTGTEASLMALRLLRAFTGKSKIIRFAGHFHGWHDHVCFPAGGAPGIVDGIVEEMIILPPNDIEAVRKVLTERTDVAGVMIEPTGATFGMVPVGGDFLRQLRALTSETGTLLLFDEVICGFRCSRGGAQAFHGVMPDVTTLAKIVAGGFPGAAVCGRTDILSLLDYPNGPSTSPKVVHQGTYNAEPVSAAAGIATLTEVRDGDVIERANRTAAAIREGCAEAIRRKSIDWCVYGCFSEFHIYPGGSAPPKAKGTVPAALLHNIRLGMLCHGVDLIGWPGGLVSAVHTAEDVDRTVTAFRHTLDWLGDEGAF